MTNETLELYLKKAEALGVEVRIVGVEDINSSVASLFEGEEPGLAAVADLSGAGEAAKILMEALERAGWRLGGISAARDADLGVTFSDAFIAETGSIVASSGPSGASGCSLLPPAHLALSLADGCRETLAGYLAESGLRLPSRLVFISGPSRTGDIEATMTKLVHGPGRVIHLVFSGPGDGASS